MPWRVRWVIMKLKVAVYCDNANTVGNYSLSGDCIRKLLSPETVNNCTITDYVNSRHSK